MLSQLHAPDPQLIKWTHSQWAEHVAEQPTQNKQFWLTTPTSSATLVPPFPSDGCVNLVVRLVVCHTSLLPQFAKCMTGGPDPIANMVPVAMMPHFLLLLTTIQSPGYCLIPDDLQTLKMVANFSDD